MSKYNQISKDSRSKIIKYNSLSCESRVYSRTAVHPIIIGLILTVSALLSQPGYAQTYIAGFPVYCTDIRGFSVVTIPDSQLNDVGVARLAPNGAPIIFLNPTILANLPPVVQLFWYAHECAHHVLGHILKPPIISNEIEADCWAIRIGRDQNWFQQHDLEVMYMYFINNPGSPWGHLPGPQRLENFARCFIS